MHRFMLALMGLCFATFIGVLILAGISLLDNSQHKNAKRDMAYRAIMAGSHLDELLDIFRAHIGRYPHNLKELLEKPKGQEGANREPYVHHENDLKDPWGEDLQYKYLGKLNGEEKYDLWSKGPDRQDGTADDIRKR